MLVVVIMVICNINIKFDSVNVKIYMFVIVFILDDFKIMEMIKMFLSKLYILIRIDIVENMKFVFEFLDFVIFDVFMILVLI